MSHIDPRYPIGKFRERDEHLHASFEDCLLTLTTFPSQLASAVNGWTNTQLDTPYREGGWTVRQLIHHVADSHMNAYIRFKWTLTEDAPTIKAYKQDLWAELPDNADMPIGFSIDFLDALHRKWVFLLHKMKETDFEKFFYHPEMENPQLLSQVLRLYTWHSKHHLAHILSLKELKGW